MPTAGNLTIEPDRIRTLPHVQCADAFGAIEFVCGKAEQVDAQRRDVDRHSADGLRGVAVEQNPAIAANLADFGQRLDDADLVVGQHHRDEQRVVAERRGQRLGIEPAGVRTGCRLDAQNRHFETPASQPGERIEHRFMFGGDRDEMIAAPPAAFGYAPDCQIVAFGGTAGEDNLARAGADGRGDSGPGIVDGIFCLPAENVAGAGRVAVDFRPKRKHRLNHPRIDPGGGMIV